MVRERFWIRSSGSCQCNFGKSTITALHLSWSHSDFCERSIAWHASFKCWEHSFKSKQSCGHCKWTTVNDMKQPIKTVTCQVSRTDAPSDVEAFFRAWIAWPWLPCSSNDCSQQPFEAHFGPKWLKVSGSHYFKTQNNLLNLEPWRWRLQTSSDP